MRELHVLDESDVEKNQVGEPLIIGEGGRDSFIDVHRKRRRGDCCPQKNLLDSTGKERFWDPVRKKRRE